MRSVNGRPILARMQRLFTMFPPGFPGLALVLLRISVALSLLLAHWNMFPAPGPCSYAIAALLLLSLCVGFLTPLAAVIALAMHGLIWMRAGLGDTGLVAIIWLNALALAILGPGAYSIDAFQFGRRKVIISPMTGRASDRVRQARRD